MKRTVRPDDAAPVNHVKDFLDCVKSRQSPVENLDVGHHVSSVAHLGNIALRSRSRIEWDAAAESVANNPAANQFVSRPYRAP